jgi:hypothetical protein
VKEQKKVFYKCKKFLILCLAQKRAIFSSSAVAVYSQYCIKHYATNRKVTGSILDEVIGFFN